MAEEKSAGSGFGKLVYGTLKGNGINTDDLSFDEAVKKFNELGGTDNWHAKIMRKEAEENKAKEERTQSAKEEANNLREQIKAMDSGDYTRVDGIPNEVVMEGFRCKKHIQQNLEATCFAIGLLKPHTSYIKRKGEEESVRQVNYDECEWRIIAPEIWDMDKGTEQSWLWSKEEYEA